jgi:hypothetical protein
MTRALATVALLGVGWLIAALAFIAGIVWALADDEKPLKVQAWSAQDDALYEIACKETA